MDNIVLVGMPSCGKSTLGRHLAKQLGYTFIDTDDVIRDLNQCELQDIIDKDGREVFLRREEEAVCSVNTHRHVIATGGSVVYSPVAMAHLKALGTIVYLYISYPTLEKRIGDPRTRGVVFAPGFGLKDMYDERTALYEQYADITLCESEGDTPTESTEKLIALLHI
ncbi:MAG: shikimate kinase [Clostridia bacterium]|nr:shikimate kinase [Clostridia bacterium]